MEDNKEVMNTNEEFDEENFEVEESDAKFGLTEALLVGAGVGICVGVQQLWKHALKPMGKKIKAKADKVMAEKEDKHHVNEDGTIEANESDVKITDVETNEIKG